MKPTCKACGSPLLESDTHCFRCHAEVQEPNTPPLPDPETQVDLRAAASYGGVVLALLIVGALLMNWMGAGSADPLAPTATPSAPAGWNESIALQGDFLVWLPSTWQIYNRSNTLWSETAGEIDHPLPVTLRSSLPRDPAERLVMVARSPAAEEVRPAEFSVAFFPDRTDLSLGILETESWWVGERWLDTEGATHVTKRESGESALIADLVYPAGDGEYTRSMTMILKTSWGLYAVSVTAMEGDDEMTEEIRNILDSFLPLERHPIAPHLRSAARRPCDPGASPSIVIHPEVLEGYDRLDTPLPTSYNLAL